jgi:hypothetical protein
MSNGLENQPSEVLDCALNLSASALRKMDCKCKEWPVQHKHCGDSCGLATVLDALAIRETLEVIRTSSKKTL